jgi:hypothetical protein
LTSIGFPVSFVFVVIVLVNEKMSYPFVSIENGALSEFFDGLSGSKGEGLYVINPSGENDGGNVLPAYPLEKISTASSTKPGGTGPPLLPPGAVPGIIIACATEPL